MRHDAHFGNRLSRWAVGRIVEAKHVAAAAFQDDGSLAGTRIATSPACAPHQSAAPRKCLQMETKRANWFLAAFIEPSQQDAARKDAANALLLFFS